MKFLRVFAQHKHFYIAAFYVMLHEAGKQVVVMALVKILLIRDN